MMNIISIKFAILRIADQNNINRLIELIINAFCGTIHNTIINRYGIIIYFNSNEKFNSFTLCEILRNYTWEFNMNWGSNIMSSSVIESFYINFNGVIYNKSIENIPVTYNIVVPHRNHEETYKYLQNKLQTYNIINDDFCKYYSQTYVNCDIIEIEHTSHNIPMNIWQEFAKDTERLFIPMSNSKLLTVQTNQNTNSIGIEALICDIENMIERDIQNFHKPHNNMYLANYLYTDHLINMRKLIDKFSIYFNTSYINDNIITYYFADNFCSLIQQYFHLRGSITKIIYEHDIELINNITQLNITNNNISNLIIFCICYDRIEWARNNNVLPKGSGDAYNIKKNIRLLIKIGMQYKLRMSLFDEYLQQIIINNIKNTNKMYHYIQTEYLLFDININIDTLKYIKRICSLKIDINNINMNYSHDILLLLNDVCNFNNVLLQTNEFLNNNIIQNNENAAYVVYKVQQYIKQYIY